MIFIFVIIASKLESLFIFERKFVDKNCFWKFEDEIGMCLMLLLIQPLVKLVHFCQNFIHFLLFQYL